MFKRENDSKIKGIQHEIVFGLLLHKYGFSGKRKLKGLQERLKQTEMAMEKILEQLNTISAEANSTVKQNLTKEIETQESLKQYVEQQDGKTEQYLRDLEEV